MRPGTDPRAVDLVYSGAQSVGVDAQGRVVLQLAHGSVVQDVPALYQDQGGTRHRVVGRYVDRGNGHVGFQVDGAYDPGAALVLDPPVLFSTYLGGAGTDTDQGVATDLQGNAYVTGYSQIPVDKFPQLYPYPHPPQDMVDIFLSKFSPTGDLLYSTLLGGVGHTVSSEGLGVAVDATGSAYLTGWTGDATYPTTTGAYQQSLPGTPTSAFVTKLSPAGNALVYSTFLGTGTPSGIALDASGAAYIVGSTGSGSSHNVFLSKLKADGSDLIYSDSLGSGGQNYGNGVAVDAAGRAFVVGSTQSSSFPTTTGAYQRTLLGTQDVFVAEYNPSGSALVYATLLGGAGSMSMGSSAGNAIAVDAVDRAYVTGVTSAADYPTTLGAYQVTGPSMGAQSAFVTRLNIAGAALDYSTFLHGMGGMMSVGSSAGNAIAVDADRNAYLTGQTTAPNFPTTTGAYQSTYKGNGDAFVARLNDGGGSLGWSSLLGGGSADQGNGLALDADANVFVVGQTASSDFPAQGTYWGGGDAFVAKFAQLAPPLLTSISPDTGSSSSDQITLRQNLTLYGKALANATVTLFRADLGQIGTTTADGGGLFTFSYGATTLPEGVYAFTGTATLGGKTSVPTAPPFLVTVDLTPPVVTLTPPATTFATAPPLQVTATDLVGIPPTTTVTLDVDLNNDGNFTDAGESGYQTATMTNGLAVFALSPALAVGTYALRARVNDIAGNQGTSAVGTMIVQTLSTPWTITDTTGVVDPNSGDPLLQRGNIAVQHYLDLDQSPGSSVGRFPFLSYNSERTNAQPIVQAQIQADNSVALPATLTAQLTINGTTQPAQTYTLSGRSPGDLLTVAQQVASPLTTTGRYPYTLTVTFNYGTPIVRSITGATFVDAEDSSPFGAGWTFSQADRLVSISAQTLGTYTFAAGELLVFGSSDLEFFAQSGGSYTSPAGENGTLAAVGGGYSYTTPTGFVESFNSSGQLTAATDRNGIALTYTYSGGNLTTLATPDGALSTFSYSGGVASGIQTGSRNVSLTVSGGTLTSIVDSDGGLHTFAYDANQHLTEDHYGFVNGTFVYAYGEVSGSSQADGGSSVYSPANLLGLVTVAAGNLWASVADGLNRTTRAQLDTTGRPLLVLVPDGSKLILLRDGNGWVTTSTDALNRTTTFTRDAQGYVTQETLPDGHTRLYQYEPTYHNLTRFTDENGNVTTYAYDTSGNLKTFTNALNQTTTFVWAGGLLQTVQDALGRVTSYVYDTNRRLQRVVDANGGIASVTYDSYGNTATLVDQLGRVTTTVNDARGNLLRTINAAGGVSNYAYDASGMTAQATNAGGQVTSPTYDFFGRLASTIQAVGLSVEQAVLNAFDAAGQLTGQRDANGYWSYRAYSATGRLVGATDAAGNQTARQYDAAGQLIGQRDALGRPWAYQYNLRGWLTQATNPASNVTTYAYDGVGNLISTTNAAGVRTDYIFDKLNRQVSVTEAANAPLLARTMTTVYDAVGNVTETTDWMGTRTDYTYDNLNRLTRVDEAVATSAARTMTYAYDAVGNLTSSTDARGYRTDNSYDVLNRVLSVRQAVGQPEERLTTYAYDALGNRTSRTDALGRVTQVGFDGLNRPITTQQAVGTSLTRTGTTLYSATGVPVVSIDPLGNATQTVPDVIGQTAWTIDAVGNVSRAIRDAVGNLLGRSDFLGVLGSMVYDGLDRLTQTVNALGNTATVVYDALGRVTVQVDELGRRTTYVYDALNRQVTVTDALNQTTTAVYDKNNNVLTLTDPTGAAVTSTYDARNRKITVQAPGIGTVTTVYDNNDNVLSVTNAAGTTRYAYDGLNQRISMTTPKNETTTFLYDKVGNLTGTIDASGNRTTYVLDALNRVVTVTDALNANASYAYDAADRLTSKTDRLGQRIAYSYDPNNRETGETWYNASGTAVNTLAYAYDTRGQMLSASDVNGAYTYIYDALGRVTHSDGPFGLSLTYGYDAASNRTSVQDSFGGLLTSVYDNNNRLSSRQFSVGGATPLRFDMTYTTRNQIATVTRYSDLGGTTKVGESDYTYDPAMRVTNIQHKNGSGGVLSNLTYTYDTVSRVSAQTMDGTPTSYAYDASGQLTTAGSATFSYDATGNRTLTGYATGAGNRLTNDGTWTYTYDAEGNQSKKSKGASAETWTFGYDNRNQMVWAEDRATDGGTLLLKLQYKYDVFGRRLEEDRWTSVTGTVVTRYGYDGADVIVDLNGSNSLTARYVRFDGVDQMAARVSGGSVNWYLTDRQGSVVALADNSGTVLDRITYDAYGNILSESAPTVGGRYKYTGREWQADLGLQYNRARWYDPRTGRWTTQDPLGLSAGDPNYYRYIGNGPPNATDPSGLDGVNLGSLQIAGSFAVSASPALLAGPASTLAEDFLRGVMGIAAAPPPAAQAAMQAELKEWQEFLEGMWRDVVGKVEQIPNRIKKLPRDIKEWIEEKIGWLKVKLPRMPGKLEESLAPELANLLAGPRAKLIAETIVELAKGGDGYAAVQRLKHVAVLELRAVLNGVDPCKADLLLGTAARVNAAIQTMERIRDAAKAANDGDLLALANQTIGVFRDLEKALTPCFVAGTPLLIPGGEKPIEQFRAGDWILSCPEHDPEGPVEARQVEEVFVRVSPVLNIHIGRQIICTSPEHPFWVRGKGWVSSKLLEPGNSLRSDDGQWMQVNSITDGGEVTTVYNLRVAEYHTYFVGSKGWGFSVWAHNNDCSGQLMVSDTLARKRLNTAMGGKAANPNQVAHHIIPYSLRDEDAIRRAARGGFNINGIDNGIWLDSTNVHRQGDTHPRYTDELREIVRSLDVLNQSDTDLALSMQRLVDELRVGLRSLNRPIGQGGAKELLENPRRWGVR